MIGQESTMRKSEMNEEQLRQRALFVDSLASAGWHGSNFNRNFDDGLWSSPEASMTYASADMSLRLDLLFEEPRLIFYIGARSGKSLGLVFKCVDRLKAVVDAVIGMQDIIASDNVKEMSKELVATCPEVFKISASGNRLIPVKSQVSRKD
jgi:hypothetical protein